METGHKPVEASHSERRTDVRIVVSVPVEITTIYHKGDTITERTIIEDVSDHGCRFTMRGAIRKGDTVSVKLLADDGGQVLDEPARLFEVMWIARGPSFVVVGARILGGEELDRCKFSQHSRSPKSLAF